MNGKLGRFLNSRFSEAVNSVVTLEERIQELKIAAQTCDDDSVKLELAKCLSFLASRLNGIAEATLSFLQSTPT